MKRQACTSATLDGGRFLFAIAHMDTCLRRYDLVLVDTYHCLPRYDPVLVDTYHCLRRYDATLEHTVSLTRNSSVAPAESGAHLSNAALKLALLAKAFAALTWIPACAGMTSFWLIPITPFAGMTLHWSIPYRLREIRASPLRRQGSISHEAGIAQTV